MPACHAETKTWMWKEFLHAASRSRFEVGHKNSAVSRDTAADEGPKPSFVSPILNQLDWPFESSGGAQQRPNAVCSRAPLILLYPAKRIRTRIFIRP